MYKQITTPPKDLVTLVDESDNVIGEMDKVEAHRHGAKRHRAVSVYLFREGDSFHQPADHEHSNKNWELLMQQRSAKKILGAHQWANTICGNVRPTETYEECAYRRLNEELGITEVVITPIYKFEYHLECGEISEEARAIANSKGLDVSVGEVISEWEIDQVFFGQYFGAVHPNPDEAQHFSWVKWEELQEKVNRADLLTNEFNTKVIEIDGKKVRLGAWFVYMMNDKELIKILNERL